MAAETEQTVDLDQPQTETEPEEEQQVSAPAPTPPTPPPPGVIPLSSDQVAVAKLAGEATRQTPEWQQTRLAVDAGAAYRAAHGADWITKGVPTAARTWEKAIDEAAVGFVRDLAFSVDPSLQYSQHSVTELDGLKTSNQAEINRLQRQIDAGEPEEYAYYQDSARIAQLNNDNATIDEQIRQKVQGGPPKNTTEWLHGTGQALLNYTNYSATAAQQREEARPKDVFFEASTAGGVSQWVGQQAAMLTEAAGGPLVFTAALVGSDFERTYRDAIAKGLPLEKAVDLGNAASVFAPAQMIAAELGLKNFLSASAGLTVGQVFRNVVRNAGTGAGMGVTGQLYQNLLYKLGGIDPDRPWNQGLAEATVSGAAGMTTLGLVGDLPSLAMRSTWKARIDPHRAPGTAEPEVTEGAPEAVLGAAQTVTGAERGPMDLPPRSSAEPTREEAAAEVERALGLQPETTTEAEKPTQAAPEVTPPQVTPKELKPSQLLAKGDVTSPNDLPMTGNEVGDVRIAKNTGDSWVFQPDGTWRRVVDPWRARTSERPPEPEARMTVGAEEPGGAAPSAQKAEEWYDSLSEEERQAVNHWMQGSHGSIQQIQRLEAQPGWTAPPTDAWKRDVDTAHNFESAVAKAPIYEGPAYRGLRNLRNEDVAPFKNVGGEIKADVSASASVNPDVPKQEFAEMREGAGHPDAQRLIMEIHGRHRAINPEGRTDLPGQPYQQEVILPKGARYRVQEFRENYYGPNQHQVVLREIGAGEREPAARKTIGAEEPLGEPESEPIDKGDLRQTLRDIRQRIGNRFNPIIATPRQLPLRYRRALEEAGIPYRNYTTFFDKDTREWVVNPDTVTTSDMLNHAGIYNLMRNSFSDKANVIPLDSWTANSEVPAVARLLRREGPNADTNTAGLYDPVSGNVYLNAGKHLSSAEPIDQAIRTINHEIAAHQGNRDQFGEDYTGYREFLRGVYRSMRQSGLGDAIAARFGTDMDGLAKQYGWGTVAEDGTLTLDNREQERLADELLGRQAEKYDPHQLDKLNNTFRKAINLIRRGYERYQGIKFSNYDAFRLLQESWKAAHPPGDPETQNALLAKRIIKSHEGTEPIRTTNTDDLDQNAQRISPVAEGLSASRGNPNTPEQIKASSDRAGADAERTGRVVTQRELSQSAPNRFSGPDHDIRLPNDPAGRAVWVTRPDGLSGPYGPSPSYEGATGERAETTGAKALQPTSPYGRNQATSDQYLERLALSNEHFGTDHRLVGYLYDEPSGTWRIVSSQPRLGDSRPANEDEISPWMAARGFHNVDASTYYNPKTRVLVLQADPAHVRIDGETGNVNPFGVAPHRVDGPLANELDSIVRDPNRTAGLADPEGVTAQALAHGTVPPQPTPEAISRFQAGLGRDQAELEALRQKEISGPLSAAEQMRRDDLEYGPLLSRDINRELGPDAPDEPPIEVLRRAAENIRRSEGTPPEKGIRASAARMAADPNESDPSRLYNLAQDQLQYNKGSFKHWSEVARGVLDGYGGDWERLANDLINGRFADNTQGHGVKDGPAVEAHMYDQLTKHIKTLRDQASAAGDQGLVNHLDAIDHQLDSMIHQKLTSSAQLLSTWQNLIYSREGFMRLARAGYWEQLDKIVEANPAYGEAVRQITELHGKALDGSFQDPNVKRIIDAVERARSAGRLSPEQVAESVKGLLSRPEESMPQRYANLITDTLLEQVKKAQLPPAARGAFQELASRIQSTIRAQMQEAGVSLTPQVRQKLSAAGTIREAMENWGYFRQVRDQLVAEAMDKFKGQPEVQHALASLDQFTDVPFSEASVKKLISEEGINVRDLIKQHYSQGELAINSLAQKLVQHAALTTEQADLVANTLSNVFRGLRNEAIQKQFDRIVEQARARGGRPISPQAQAQTRSRMLELFHMGAFGNREVAEALGPAFGYTGYHPEMEAELQEIADKFERFKQEGRNGFQTEAVRADFDRAFANYLQASGWRWGTSLFQGNLVANTQSHIVGMENQFLKGQTTAIHFLRTSIRGPEDLPAVPGYLFNAFQQSIRSFFNVAMPQAWQTLRTGERAVGFLSPEELASPRMTGRARLGSFEYAPTQRLLSQFIDWLGNKTPVQLPEDLAGAGKAIDVPYSYVHRAIEAMYGLIKDTNDHTYAWQLAVRQARDQGIPWEEARDQADEMLRPTDKGTLKAIDQRIAAEGLTGLEAKLRRNELIDQAMPEQLSRDADYYGLESVSMTRPPGIMGVFEHLISLASQKIPIVRYMFPIVRIPMNSIELGLQVNPIGFITRLFPKTYFGSFGLTEILTPQRMAELREAGRPIPSGAITPEQFNELKGLLVTRAFIGTGLLASAAVTQMPILWGGQPIGGFTIHGGGPSDPVKRNQQRDGGWKPYSIQWGNNYWQFEAWPIWPGLAAIGNFLDAYRYPKSGEMPTPDSALLRSVNMIGPSLVDHSFLRGMNGFLDAINKTQNRPEEFPTTLENFMSNIPVGVPFIGMTGFRQAYENFIDDKLYQAKGWKAVVRDTPFMAPLLGAKPVLNGLGEPVHVQGAYFQPTIPGMLRGEHGFIPIGQRIWSGGSDDEVWNFLDGKNLWITKPNSIKLNGKALNEDQRYDFTAFRGQRLRSLLSENLSTLRSISDQDQLEKTFRGLEKQANAGAKEDMLSGRKPTF